MLCGGAYLRRPALAALLARAPRHPLREKRDASGRKTWAAQTEGGFAAGAEHRHKHKAKALRAAALSARAAGSRPRWGPVAAVRHQSRRTVETTAHDLVPWILTAALRASSSSVCQVPRPMMRPPGPCVRGMPRAASARCAGHASRSSPSQRPQSRVGLSHGRARHSPPPWLRARAARAARVENSTRSARSSRRPGSAGRAFRAAAKAWCCAPRCASSFSRKSHGADLRCESHPFVLKQGGKVDLTKGQRGKVLMFLRTQACTPGGSSRGSIWI